MDVVKSKNDVPIRLTKERWFHITEGQPEMAGYYFEVLETLEEPDVIYEGKTGEYIAVKDIENGKYIAVIYREVDGDGFVITAFLTKRKKQLERRHEIWKHLR